MLVCAYKADKAPKSTQPRSIVYHGDVGFTRNSKLQILNCKFLVHEFVVIIIVFSIFGGFINVKKFTVCRSLEYVGVIQKLRGQDEVGNLPILVQIQGEKCPGGGR